MQILVSKINRLGDAVSFLPTLRGLADAHPGAGLTVLCTPLGREVFEGCADNLDCIVVNARDMRGVRSLPAAVRILAGRPGFRADISFHSYDEPSLSYLVAYLLRIPVRIGFRSGIARLETLLTHRLPFSTQRNVVDINYDLVRHAASDPDATPHRGPIACSATDKAIVDDRLRALGLRPERPFAVVHPGARNPYREWPLEKFIEVTDRLERRHGVPAVFVSEQMVPPADGLRQIGGLTIKQLACILDRAALFVGNNSGPMHMAAAMGTPCVAIQGPTAANWEIFWRDRPHQVLKASHLACLPCERLDATPTGLCTNASDPNGCMKAISTDLVIQAIERILERTSHDRNVG